MISPIPMTDEKKSPSSARLADPVTQGNTERTNSGDLSEGNLGNG